MSVKGAKNIEIQATLEENEIVPVMQVAREQGPLPFALTAWGYEYGSRISEFGMQLMKDTDVRLGRARPAHLKSGQKQAWHLFFEFTRTALPLWLAERETWTLEPKRKLCLFPSRIAGHRCYVCRGTGERPRLRRDGARRFIEGVAPCEQCRGTGERWGLAAPEAYKIIHSVLVAAGIPDGEPSTRTPTLYCHASAQRRYIRESCTGSRRAPKHGNDVGIRTADRTGSYGIRRKIES